MRELTDTDRAVIALAAATVRLSHDRRRMLIYTRLNGMSVPRFYQHLNALIDDADARAQAPVQLGRLERIREARRAAR